MPPQAALDVTVDQSQALFKAGGIDLLAWPALIRKLDRTDPSYRN
jgi:hypothetical protein